MSQSALHEWRVVPPARTLLLSFLSTAGGAPMRAVALTRRAAVLDVDAAAVRMALRRLLKEGRVMQPERGAYAIGAEAAALDRVARGWRDAEARTRPWKGRWLVVGVDHLGRSDRRQSRLRERALRLTGFALSQSGWWVRPDNLATTLQQTRSHLAELGLDAGAAMLGDAVALADYASLWDAETLTADYRFWSKELAASEARIAHLEPQAAARETLLLGQAVIRTINRDPLLPAEMVDAAARTAMVAAMRHYDAIGKGLWAAID